VVVLGLIAMATRWLKRVAPARFQGLPDDAVQWLGKKVIGNNEVIHLVRVGERVLVLGSGPDGLRTLSEVTDETEVARLELLARSTRPGSTSSRAQSEISNPTPTRPPIQYPANVQQPRSAPAARTGRFAGVMLFALSLLGASALAQGAVVPASDVASASTASSVATTASVTSPLPVEPLAPDGIWSSLKIAGLVSIVSLAPAILIMTTCYVRIIVVLGILRQGIGMQQFPPTQVLTALSLFLTALVMWPVWQRSYEEGVRPYTEGTYSTAAEQEAALSLAANRSIRPVREFMSQQIEATGNEAAIDLMLEFQNRNSDTPTPQPEFYEDVPLQVLLPAFLLGELKTAFLIGFQIYLPFLVIDLVVSSLLVSLGMVMVPPATVSLPFKLLLFVLVDGWTLTVQMLLSSIAG